MKEKIKKILPILLIFTANIVYAAGLVPCTDNCTVCDFFVLIKNILDFLVKISFSVAVIILIYGGIMMVTAAGSEQRISKGKSAIWQAVWGMLITFGAWLIVDTILKTLTNSGGLNNWMPWNSITC